MGGKVALPSPEYPTTVSLDIAILFPHLKEASAFRRAFRFRMPVSLLLSSSSFLSILFVGLAFSTIFRLALNYLVCDYCLIIIELWNVISGEGFHSRTRTEQKKTLLLDEKLKRRTKQ
ncbi:hypothetical protein SLE2022_110930 [Rubroshorea leprosula]